MNIKKVISESLIRSNNFIFSEDRKKRITLCAGYVLGLILLMYFLPLSIHAAAKPFTYNGETVFYYVPSEKGFESLQKNVDKIDIFAPQVYGLDENGKLYGKISDTVNAFLQIHPVKVMPLLVNQSFDDKTIEKILDNPVSHQAIADSLVKEAQEKGFVGWQLDIEHMHVSYKDKYSSFVKTIGKAMHDNGLLLSVAVIGKTSDDPTNYPFVSWDEWVGVYDFKALEPSVDFLSIMAYDDPYSIGPVAGMPFYTAALDYALKTIPPSKISFGVPVYAWDWKINAEKKNRDRGHEYARDIFSDKRNISNGYDHVQQVQWVTYYTKTKPKEKRKLWYENLSSLQPKLQLLTSKKVRGISVWVLGLEDPKFWNVL